MQTLVHVISQVDAGSAESAGGIAGGLFGGLIGLAFLILTVVGYWKVFTKIGLPGWMGIIPFVNIYMIYKARGQHEPVVWLILCLIPCIQIIGFWFLASDTAELFGKGVGWKLFLFLIPGLSHMILGFGSSAPERANIAPGVGLNAA